MAGIKEIKLIFWATKWFGSGKWNTPFFAQLSLGNYDEVIFAYIWLVTYCKFTTNQAEDATSAHISTTLEDVGTAMIYENIRAKRNFHFQFNFERARFIVWSWRAQFLIRYPVYSIWAKDICHDDQAKKGRNSYANMHLDMSAFYAVCSVLKIIWQLKSILNESNRLRRCRLSR